MCEDQSELSGIPLQSSPMPDETAPPPTTSEPAPEAAADDPGGILDRRAPELEGDYRPAAGTYLDPVNVRIEATDYN